MAVKEPMGRYDPPALFWHFGSAELWNGLHKIKVLRVMCNFVLDFGRR